MRSHHTPLESKWSTPYPGPIANEYILHRYLVGKVWLVEDKNTSAKRLAAVALGRALNFALIVCCAVALCTYAW